MLKRAWILIGDQNSRKSSVVRGLTTVDGPNTPVEIEEKSGLRFHLHKSYVSSRNEGDGAVTPDELIKSLQELRETESPDTKDVLVHLRPLNIIMTLRYTGQNGVDGIHYVKALINDDWDIKAIVSLNQLAEPWITASGIRYASLLGTDSEPGSVTASRIRQLFDWR